MRDARNGSTPTGPTFAEIVDRRLSRRAALAGAAAAVPVMVFGGALAHAPRAAAYIGESIGFPPIALSEEDTVLVPPGYSWKTLIRWGDPLFPEAPTLDLDNQSQASQERQFGYNNDFVGFFPLPDYRYPVSDRGLLAVSHEYVNPELMFPAYDGENLTEEQVAVEMAAHGATVIEVFEAAGEWLYSRRSAYNRRITAETAMAVTGPAAGHELLQTTADPTGARVLGTLNNCSGGKTPWGTALLAEENFQDYFGNADGIDACDPRRAVHERYGLPAAGSELGWEKFHDRFDASREPNEPFRFGWIVEIDPYDPDATPKKHTALGRFRHEAATVVIAPDGKAVVYSGDDQRFDYMYKFVSSRAYDPHDRAHNLTLLEEGDLYAARFEEGGAGCWLKLAAGEGCLAGWSAADVLINTRGAADLLGATPMDRPEDIETNPVTGKLYAVMTNNTERAEDDTDAANPRGPNAFGHIIEITEEADDPTAAAFTWDIFILCGDPEIEEHRAYYAGYDMTKVSPFANPDNVAFDARGNLWIATDGQPDRLGKNDGVFAMPTVGAERGYARQFVSAPAGAEICGPEFTPDNRAFFCAMQHPGEGGTIAAPTSTWPDNTSPAKPSLVVITKAGGSRVIGS